MDRRWITDSTPDPRFRIYTRANAGEVLSRPCSPLGWSMFWDGAIIPGWRDAYLELGVLLPEELSDTDPPVCGNFGGYLYNNLSMVRTWSIRSPGGSADAGDRAFIGDHPDLPPYRPDPLDDNDTARARTAESIGRLLSHETYPGLDEQRERSLRLRGSRPELTGLSDAELVQHARRLMPTVRRLFAEHTVVSIGAALGPAMLAGLAARLGDDSIPMRAVAGLGEVDSAAPSLALWELSRTVRDCAELTALFDAGADGLLDRITGDDTPTVKEFRARLDGFLDEFGSRGPDEWDIARDTWETRPSLALATIDRARHVPDDRSPHNGHQQRRTEREALEVRLRAELAADGEALATCEAALRASRVYLRGRERAKTTIVRVLHEARVALRELADRHTRDGHLRHPDELWQLTDPELDSYLADPPAFAELLSERRAAFAALHDLEPPYFIVGTPPPLDDWPVRHHRDVERAELGDVLVGIPGAPGVHTGAVRIVTDPEEIDELEPGDVLVTPSTDPSWTPLFLTAAAVIVETGAQTSHAVIVSRELGLPCVPSVADATRRLTPGMQVTVDGNTGTVTVGDPA